MELALALGQPLSAIQAMPMRDLQAWAQFAERRMLPQRRIEMYLAQVALLIAKTMGGASNVKLQDFMFDAQTVDDLDDAIEAFDFRPRKKKG